MHIDQAENVQLWSSLRQVYGSTYQNFTRFTT